MTIKTETVNCIRRFNRFYTVLLGLLNQNYLGSGYSVTETRILFEIHTGDTVSAKDLCNLLKLDKSYVSRIIKGFEKKEIVKRVVSENDRRAHDISLTDKGHNVVNELVQITNKDLNTRIGSLDDAQCRQICNAMKLIIETLGYGGNSDEK